MPPKVVILCMQCPHHICLVEPRDFGFNEQTAASNSFQYNRSIANQKELVYREFDGVVQTLKQNNIACTVVPSPLNVHVPDAVFPNNWFAAMPSGQLIVFPMYAPNRRDEVNAALLEKIKNEFAISETVDLTGYANENNFLEGTGSIVFDHDNKIAYACESPRTSVGLFNQLCKKINYKPVTFLSCDLKNKPVYHTNVMMSIGKNHVVICLESITDPIERSMIMKTIEAGGKKIIDIDYTQMDRFCGNVLQVLDTAGKLVWLMSQEAFNGFTETQLLDLKTSGSVVSIPIHTIETLGGGSLRCMLAGIHAPLKQTQTASSK